MAEDTHTSESEQGKPLDKAPAVSLACCGRDNKRRLLGLRFMACTKTTLTTICYSNSTATHSAGVYLMHADLRSSSILLLFKKVFAGLLRHVQRYTGRAANCVRPHAQCRPLKFKELVAPGPEDRELSKDP